MIENVKNTNNTEIPTKLIFKPVIARELIKQGFKVVDLKQNRDYPERSILVFEDSLDLRNAMQKIIKERRRKFSERHETKEEEIEEKRTLED